MRWFLIALLLVAATAASAQFLGNSLRSPGLTGGLGMPGIGSSDSSGNPPPACGNELDFSDACNSQYLGVL